MPACAKLWAAVQKISPYLLYIVRSVFGLYLGSSLLAMTKHHQKAAAFFTVPGDLYIRLL